MRNLWFVVAMLGLLLAAPAHAQQPVSVIARQGIARQGIAQRRAPVPTLAAVDSAGRPAPQAENTWSFPARERHDSDAAAAVRRKAEFRALGRRHRIAASRWYGFSNSRPAVSPTPWWGTHRSAWVSGTGRRRNAWPGTRWPTYFVQSDRSLSR